MSAYPVLGPRLVGRGGVGDSSFKTLSFSPAQNEAFADGDFVQILTTGAVTGKTSIPAGALAAVPGPVFGGPANINSTAAFTVGNITVTGVASAGAPAQSFYVFATYTAAGIESLAGPEFVVNCAPGFTFSVNVLAAAAPAAADHFAVYSSAIPGGELLQQATKTTTALGTAFTVPATLVNSVGLNRAPNGANSNVGFVINDSAEVYATGLGGSFSSGGLQQPMGAWMPGPTLGSIEPMQSLVVSLIGTPLEINFLQPWNESLINSTVGISLDASGYYVADSTQNPIFYIQGKVGAPDNGGVGDTYVRVVVLAYQGVL